MVNSMTGFAAHLAEAGGERRQWEIRSVNARGLDVRLRLPEGCEALEAPLRAAIARVARRGNVSLTLRRSAAAGMEGLQLDPARLAAVLDDLARAEAAAAARGIALAPSTAAQVLSIRGLLDGAREVNSLEYNEVKPEVDALLEAFAEMRAREGAAIAEVLAGQIDRIAALVEEAARAAAARTGEMRAALERNLARLLEAARGAVDAGRLEQELALMAVKADVTEELDRLRAHVAAARALMAEDGPVGRKLDFLTQEFNREANTLCAKAGNAELTRIGLELKTVIDQMREQVQNLE